MGGILETGQGRAIPALAAHRAWGNVAIFALFTAVSMADRMSIALLIGPIKRVFALGDFQISLLVGPAFAVFNTVFTFPCAWLADRMSRRLLIAGTMVFWSLATMAGGLASSFGTLVLCRALIGIGEAGLSPASNAMIGDSFPRERMPLPVAILALSISMGGALGIMATGAILHAAPQWDLSGWPLLAVMAPWQLAFVIVGFPGVVLAALSVLIAEPPRPARPISLVADNAEFADHLRSHRAFYITCFGVISLGAVILGCMISWTAEYMARNLHSDPLQIGKRLGLISLGAAILSQTVAGTLGNRISRRGHLEAPLRWLRWPLLMLVPVALVLYTTGSEPVFLGAYFCLSLCVTPTTSLTVSSVMLVTPPAFRSRINGLGTIAVGIIGFGIGPSVVGALSNFAYGETHLNLALLTTVLLAATGAQACVRLAIAPMRRALAAAAESVG